MAYFDSFIERHSLTTEREFTADEIAAMKVALVPDAPRGFLETHGLANANGRYFTVDPVATAPLLEAWGVDPAKCFVFMRSALGCLYGALDDERVLYIDPHGGTAQILDGDIVGLYVSMDMFSMNNLLDEKNGKTPSRATMNTLVPSRYEEPVIVDATLEEVDFVEGSLRLAALRKGKLESGDKYPKLAGGPKGAKLPEKKAAKPAAKKSRVATVAFESPALHMLVLAHLWDSKAIDRAEIAGILRNVREKNDDLEEDELIEKGMAALARFALPLDAVRAIESLGFVQAFEMEFEKRLGLDLGGEGEYRQLDSLVGIEKLTSLTSLDLESLSLTYGPAIDLSSLSSHPALRVLKLGDGLVEGLDALSKLETLERIVVPAGAPTLDANEAVAALIVAAE